jgi:oligopeptidase A
MFRVPEIGEELPEKNPLLGDDGLPEFNNITIEKCIGAIGKQSIDIEKHIKNLEDHVTSQEKVSDIFQDVINPLEEINTPLETTWGLAKTLYLGNKTLMPTKQYLTIHDRARRARATKFNSQAIYYAIKRAKKEDSNSFDDGQKRLINKYILEARLNGIELEGSARFQLNECIDKLGKERAKFHGKVETAKKQFKQNCNDPKIIKEFPPSLLQALAVDPKQAAKGPWRITLQPFVIKKFFQYCPDHHLRWNVWQADTRKCSGQNDKSVETSTHIEEIRYLRRKQAKVLGYETYMDMSMETKMIGSVANVQDMLSRLVEVARPVQDEEIASLQEFAANDGFKRKLEIQDVPYYKRHQLQELFGYDTELVRDYFPLPKVLSGLFEISEKLFNIKIQERMEVNKWHEDVKYFDVFDLKEGGKEPIAGFYVDLYAREDEKVVVSENSGWMVGIRNRSVLTHTKPMSALIFNFQTPLYGKPSLLSLSDVKLLFSKFGHALQHLLTKSSHSDLAGLSNVEWDAVEISGHVMANLLDNENVLKLISAHYSTEDPLPDTLINAIIEKKKHLAGFRLCRELYLTALDLELHTKKDFWLEIVKDLYPKFIGFELDKKDAHPCSFTPIFTGEWGGAYFSHVWSKLVAADVYGAFYEASKSPNEQDFLQVGERFRNTFLCYGGSLHPSEIFRRFRGRDPSHKALLKSLGLKQQQQK